MVSGPVVELRNHAKTSNNNQRGELGPGTKGCSHDERVRGLVREASEGPGKGVEALRQGGGGSQEWERVEGGWKKKIAVEKEVKK